MHTIQKQEINKILENISTIKITDENYFFLLSHHNIIASSIT